MKKSILQIAILLLGISSSQAQVCGRTTLFNKASGTWISVNGSLPYITTYGEENFCVEMTEKLNKLFILESWISIEIINIPKNTKANLGDLEIPMRKSVPIGEYEKFTDEEKKMIISVHCNTQLIGYEYLNQLQNSKIIFTCNNIKHELDKFEFDVKVQKVIIDWKNLKPCAN